MSMIDLQMVPPLDDTCGHVVDGNIRKMYVYEKPTHLKSCTLLSQALTKLVTR
jgi:hypothetical protein